MQRKARWLFKKSLRASWLPETFQETLLFLLKVGYWPCFRKPLSFSEKLHYRKINETDSRLASLSDKIRVRKYVSKKIGRECLVPLLYQGNSLDAEQLHSMGDKIVVKRNDDSGSTILINTNTLERSQNTVSEITTLKRYGESTNEWWYQKMETQYLVEKKLPGDVSDRPTEYKFFIFNQHDGRTFFVVEVIRRYSDGKIKCGIFDNEMKRLTVGRKGCERFTESFPAPHQFSEMRDIAISLGSEFNFVRVDLYCTDEKVYFSELTFCPSEGRCGYTDPAFDFYLGSKWESLLLSSHSNSKPDSETRAPTTFAY